MTITEAQEKLKNKECTAVELASGCLGAVEAHEKEVDAYLEVFDDVLEQAKKTDEAREKGREGALLGIPMALKDNLLIKGRHATAGSKILENYTASYDATSVLKLREAGAVFMGRTNLDEFAMGSSTENSAFQKTKNPHDHSRVPGGSSGGSAAVVAYGGALAALGSDTGGSIRQPASFCGVVGLKPTYGAVSRHGLIAMGSSLDIVGPLAQSVEDAELIFDAIKGKDAHDMTSRESRDSASTVKTIGVPRHFLESGVGSAVLEVFEKKLAFLEKTGYVVKDITLPSIDYALASYYIVMPAEVSSNLARFDGVRFGLHEETPTLLEDYTQTREVGFGTEAKRRILVGTYVLSSGYYDAYYVRANALRGELREDFARAFESVDVVATPTVPAPAFALGEKSNPLSMYASDIFTVPANLTGIPALSVPMGSVEVGGKKLPIGFQIMAPHLEEERLFSIGAVLEKA